MYCLLRGILPDKIKYICTAKPETESIVKPASIPTKMAVPSTILCPLMCCHAELNAITGRVPRVRGWVYPSWTPVPLLPYRGKPGSTKYFSCNVQKFK